ncbi:MAG: calcium-transporting P-type ATPase, PMR1-type [Methanosarcinales archaeon Met12]|nr:MAG: calcium-transporting P-type ATPase, PMR1-type [Methanosarcinales archaeon Met12]
MEKDKQPYSLTIEGVLTNLGSSLHGLSHEEARQRLEKFGHNELVKKKGEFPLLLLLAQFTNFLVIILIIAAAVSAFLGKEVEFITIMAIVIMAGVLGFVQEYRAEKALEALRRLAAPIAKVLRGGKEEDIPASELVPGDIVLLRTGDKIPADGRIAEAINLKTDEASLTGESVPVEKTGNPIEKEKVATGDQKNMAFFGTIATYGRGKFVVTATGMQTEFGKIADMLQEVEEKKTPLQVNMDRISKSIGIVALILCGVIAIFGVLRGYPILEMFVWGVALAVAVIPEALPAVVTISLALGVRRMVKKHALIRKLSSVETLGCVTYICSDKTGTLTRNEMTVRRLWANNKFIDVSGSGYIPEGEFFANGKTYPHNDPHLQSLLRIGALCNDAELVFKEQEGIWNIKGDPTEGALTVAAAKAGLKQFELNNYYKRDDEVPFTSERKRMTTIHSTPDSERLAYSKGAPEVILSTCKYIYSDGLKERALTQEDREAILNAAHEMASQALRVVGMSYQVIEPGMTYPKENIEQDMVFAGLAGMIDPPREEVKEAVKVCEEAGIKPLMITGDHKITAMAIGKELGILRIGEAVSGIDLDSMSDEEFEKRVETIEIYARVSPEHKIRIVKALQKNGHIAAMTGDGVNDAPALKQADIGVAMGITGTDVSKEASHMILLDDNFTSIVSAVEEGRTIFANIRKYLVYLLTGNTGSVFGMVAALFAGLPLPLSAVQILFINLLMDGAPAVALSVEPPEPGVMKKPPRNPKESIFNRHALAFIPLMGIWIALCAFGLFIYNLQGDNLEEAMTVFFAVIISMRLMNALNCKSADTSLFKLGIFSNKWLILAMASSFLLMLAAIYVPTLRVAFGTVPLTSSDWLMIAAAAFSVIIVDEIRKVVRAK